MNIQNIDCFKFLEQLPNKSVDFICIDPPYGVLTGHKIETQINVPKLFLEFKRVLKDNSFVAFFGQMPTLLDWCLSARDNFFFAEHVVWAKRNITSPYLQIQRTHEEIMIYKNSTKSKYFDTQARYEDLKIPLFDLGLIQLASIKMHITDLQRRLTDRKYDDLYYSGLPTANDTQNGKNNDDFHLKNYKINKDEFEKIISENTKQNSESDFRNDKQTAKMYEAKTNASEKKENTNDKFYSQEEYGSSAKNSDLKGVRYPSKWYRNITNLWSFLPENQTTFGENGANHKHPTVKSLLLVERLLKLCLPKPTQEYKPVVLDCFLGSGTTAIACENLGYDFVGCELDKTYYDNLLIRLEKQKNKNSESLF